MKNKDLRERMVDFLFNRHGILPEYIDAKDELEEAEKLADQLIQAGFTHLDYVEIDEDELIDYDCGLINDFGGGNVGWWMDYICSEIGQCNDYWKETIANSNCLKTKGE